MLATELICRHDQMPDDDVPTWPWPADSPMHRRLVRDLDSAHAAASIDNDRSAVTTDGR